MIPAATIKDTSDIRNLLLDTLKGVQKKEISATEARLVIGLSRAILDTLKVEMAAAHLAQANTPSVSLTSRVGSVGLRQVKQ